MKSYSWTKQQNKRKQLWICTPWFLAFVCCVCNIYNSGNLLLTVITSVICYTLSIHRLGKKNIFIFIENEHYNWSEKKQLENSRIFDWVTNTIHTDVTSSGIVNTIKNEKLQAVKTDNVTSGCWRWTFPYRYNDAVANMRATMIPNTNKYAIMFAFGCTVLFFFKKNVNQVQ